MAIDKVCHECMVLVSTLDLSYKTEVLSRRINAAMAVHMSNIQCCCCPDWLNVVMCS